MDALNPYLTFGGYPNNGYPPMFSNGLGGIIPGYNTPLEVTGMGGTTFIPPQQSNMYVPGGTISYQGGFNPLSGTISQGYIQPGIPRFIGNPYYGYNNIGIPQNDFNSQYIADILYSDKECGTDMTKVLEEIFLSEEDRRKINGNGFNGYDYYGRPIYNSALAESQRRQREIEEFRKSYQDHFVMLSRIAHFYNKEEFKEEQTRKRFDPFPQQQTYYNRGGLGLFDWQNSSEEEKEKYERESIYYKTSQIVSLAQYREAQQPYIEQATNQMFAQIKESHDRLLGVEPGSNYDLKTFMENGYKIMIANTLRENRKKNSSGKYSRNEFRAGLSQHVNQQIPITSKDDEYVSIENMLKGVFDRNKSVDSIFRNQNGETSILSQPVSGELQSEREKHLYFLQKMEEQRKINDIKTSARDARKGI